MNILDLDAAMLQTAQEVEHTLVGKLTRQDTDTAVLWESMQYSVLGGGKRIRPFLTLSFCDLFQGSKETALCFAAAVEMVHTYSLIHDDLPCMDNDDYRRGKLTNHRVFGEAEAVLAGDALLTLAFETLAQTPASAETVVRAIQVLSHAAGAQGMVGGQIMDMRADKAPVDFDGLVRLQNKKTGALISAAAELGCIASAIPAEDPRYLAAKQYAEKIGLTFQIVDDILDRYGNEAFLGKAIGRDEKDGKTTFLTFMNREKAEKEAGRLTQEAKDALAVYPGAEGLIALADWLLKREK